MSTPAFPPLVPCMGIRGRGPGDSFPPLAVNSGGKGGGNRIRAENQRDGYREVLPIVKTKNRQN
jgi:hypothetical protein